MQKPSPAIPQKPAEPQAPVSLANQPPAAATIQIENGQLTIHANNSALLQILQSISAQTGMKIQGSPGDHRIFGTYGPGTPREVLSQLLSGFSFNYLLVGTAPNGAPRQLILAGAAASMPEPSQPAQSIQPAPQNTLPQPQFGPRPSYQPQPPTQQPPAERAPTLTQPPANMPHTVPSPQQILKELEAMHAKQQGSSH
ncbi:MAG: hypothetical protein ACP5M4_08720 [Acidobacteriaceae bacterium]